VTLETYYVNRHGSLNEFRVYLRTNDAVEPEKVLLAKSDWGP